MTASDESLGSVLGSALVMGPLLTKLVTIGVFSKEDANCVIDSALEKLNRLQAEDDPRHFLFWDEARDFVLSLRQPASG
jgi:hypothetical protein